jgi:hypothetical protein
MSNESFIVDGFIPHLVRETPPLFPFELKGSLASGVAPVARRITGTGGDIMFAQMKEAGVKYLFTNTGSYEAGLFDALRDQTQVKLIMGLHEGIVVAMPVALP